MTLSSFEMPAFYSYPPYFTLQPVEATRERQLALWASLVASYARHRKRCVLDIVQVRDDDMKDDDTGDAGTSGRMRTGTLGAGIFVNERIKRSLPEHARAAVVEKLIEDGRADWIDKQRGLCLVFPKQLEILAELLHEQMQAHGQLGCVLTVDEVAEGVEIKGTELEGTDMRMIRRIIVHLQQQDKAVLFRNDDEDEEGVKFM